MGYFLSRGCSPCLFPEPALSPPLFFFRQPWAQRSLLPQMWRWLHNSPLPFAWQLGQPNGRQYHCWFWDPDRVIVNRSSTARFFSIDSFKVASSQRTACSAAIKLSSLLLPTSVRFNFLSVVAGWAAPSPDCDVCTSLTFGFLWREEDPNFDFLSVSSKTFAEYELHLVHLGFGGMASIWSGWLYPEDQCPLRGEHLTMRLKRRRVKLSRPSKKLLNLIPGLIDLTTASTTSKGL